MTRQTKNRLLVGSLVVSVAAFAATEWIRQSVFPYRTFIVDGVSYETVVSPNGAYLATVRPTQPDKSYRKMLPPRLIVWNIKTGHKLYDAPVIVAFAGAPKFVSNGDAVMFESYGKQATHDLRTGSVTLKTLPTPSDITETTSPNGRYRLVYRPNPKGGAGSYHVVLTATGKSLPLQTDKDDSVNFWQAGFTAKGDLLYAPNVRSETVLFWSPTTGKRAEMPREIPQRAARLTGFAESPDGSRMATAWSDKKIVVASVGGSRVTADYTFPADTLSWMYFRDKGRFLVVRGGNHLPCEPGDSCSPSFSTENTEPIKREWMQIVWDTTTGAPITIQDSDHVSRSGYLLKDGRALCDLRDGRQWQLRGAHNENVYAENVVAGGRYIIGQKTTSNGGLVQRDRTVYLWRVPAR